MVVFRVDPTRLARQLVLAGVALAIGLAWLDWQFAGAGRSGVGPLGRFCNATREDGLASWLTMVQAAAVAALAWTCAAILRRTGAGPWHRAGWVIVALVLSWVALDDGTHLHERLGTMFDQAVRATRRDALATGPVAWLARYPSYGWQVVVGPPFATAAACAVAVLWRDLATRRARGALLVICALVAVTQAMDFIEGLDREHAWNLYARLATSERLDDWSHRSFGAGAFNALIHGSRVLEELLELLAGTLLLALLVLQLFRLAPAVCVRAGAQPETGFGRDV